MTEPSFLTDTDGEDAPDNRRNLIIAGTAVGAVAIAGVAFLLLSGGGSSDDVSNSVIPRGHPANGGAAAASPSAAAPTPEAAVETANVSSTDPFQVPTRILQALAPPAPPPSAAAAPSGASPSSGKQTGTTAIAGGTPGTTATVVNTKGTKATASNVQFVQLLGAKKSGSRWAVTVRTNHGTCTGIKEGAVKVCGTDFSFTGEDETTGKATFVFVFGEVQGGNLVPDAKQKAVPVRAGNSALVAVNGKVDGGLASAS